MNYRRIWEIANGPIPRDEEGRSYEIHHIDGNRDNNDLDNLLCISIEDHYKIHLAQKEYLAAKMISDRMNPIPQEERILINSKISQAMLGDNNPAKRPEVRKKISEARKGKPSSMKGKTNLGASLYHRGKKMSEETILKRTATRKLNGVGAPNKGIPHTEETRQKISLAAKVRVRRPHSEETRNKISESHKKRFLK